MSTGARPISGGDNECGPGPQSAPPYSPPPTSSTSRWAAEMSSSADGPEQITNNAWHYSTAETLLEMVNPSDGDLRWNNRRGGGGAGGGGGGTGEGGSIRYKTQNISL